MHELPVTEAILSVAVAAAEKAGGRPILAIDLVIGELSSIVDDSVQFYFDILSQGTLAEGAQLRFRREPGMACCLDCQGRFPVVAPLPATCPACGSHSLQVSGGQDFFMESIEVADESPGDPTDPGRE